VIRDTTPPTTTIHLPGVASLRFRVVWSGDDECGVCHYDVQYKAGAGGTWTDWLTATTQTEATFLGQSNQTYYFRVQATDNVSNTSNWIESGAVTIQAVRKNYHLGDQLVATRRGDEVYFIHGDHLGSTSLTTDNSGTLVAETRYLPYGEERWTAGGAQPTDFTFTGQRAERGFGLMDYQARYYDPRLGRFISPDSIVLNFGNPQAWNRYSYVYNNPLNYTDPSGHCGGGTGPGNLGAEILTTACRQLLKYREDIFFPDEDTTFGERLEASYVVGVLSVAIAWATVEGFIGGAFFDPGKWDTSEKQLSNEEVRKWYLEQTEDIPELNEQWKEEGLSPRERAERAYEIRHNARLQARGMMANPEEVEQLRARDMEKYGNPDGPTFEDLVTKAGEKGYTGDDRYEYIVDSSYRTDDATNKKFGLEGRQ
jgi:RHS repeat-associated protein